MAKLTKEKVKAMLPNDLICVPCDTAAELDSVYQTAFNARVELAEKGGKMSLSKSNVTMTVVVRTFA